MKRKFTVTPKSKITATTYSDSGYPVFMLMCYSGGSEGMESDEFYPVGSFFGDSDDSVFSLNKKLDRMKDRGLLPDEGAYGQYYVADYNDYFDDGSEVYQNLETLVDDYFDMTNDLYDYEELPFT